MNEQQRVRWVNEARQSMQEEYYKLTDPVAKMQYLEEAAKLLGVHKSNVLSFLQSNRPLTPDDIKLPASEKKEARGPQ